MASLLNSATFISRKADGTPNALGRVYTYAAGGLTPLASYTTQAGGTPQTNPVILDADGTAQIWLTPTLPYRIIEKTSADVTIRDADNISGGGVTAADLASTASGKGDALIGQLRTFTGAVATTPHAWHEAQIIDFVGDMLADSTGAVDCTGKFQTAITAGSVRVGPGTYTMSWTAISADISIPANRKIIIEKGATVTMTGGRFTAENASNVEWQIDGWVKSVAMRTAASKPLWTASVGERGFIEFAENYVASSAASGFWVHGTGKVSGDWTGTPNVSDLANQVNKKGIACWNSKNVLVEGLEVYGFDGEAIYASFFDLASRDIVFRFNNVHDTRFNALNFNAGTNGGGCRIYGNFARTAYQVETSVGECTDNDIRGMVNVGIYTGGGAGSGPITIARNYIADTTTLHGIGVIFDVATPVTGVTVADNTIVNSGQYGIYVDYARRLAISDNTISGTGTAAGGYDIGLSHTLRADVMDNTFYEPGGFAQTSRVTADAATCFDISVCPESNVYLATTGAAGGRTGNGIASVASAAALQLPTLGKLFLVTGTTTITSIAAAVSNANHDGREIRLIFAGVLTLTDGANLKLAGNFVTTADDTITLVCDGTNWFEVCRSVN